MKKTALFLSFLLLVLVACNSATPEGEATTVPAEPLAQASATSIPPTPTSSPTLSPSATNSPSQTASPTSTETPIPQPTATLAPINLENANQLEVIRTARLENNGDPTWSPNGEYFAIYNSTFAAH